MSLDNKLGIRDENCINLKSILAGTTEERKDYEFIGANVKLYLFSNYEERRTSALEKLKNFLILI